MTCRHGLKWGLRDVHLRRLEDCAGSDTLAEATEVELVGLEPPTAREEAASEANSLVGVFLAGLVGTTA